MVKIEQDGELARQFQEKYQGDMQHPEVVRLRSELAKASLIDDKARSAIRLLAYHVERLIQRSHHDAPENAAESLLEVRQLRDSLQPPSETPATGPQTARGIPEPGDLIANGDCPICGSTITVEHGDEPGEIAFLAHSNQQGRDLAEQALRLLREWRATPFFETREEWRRWVDDFGARVDKVLE